MNVYPLFAMRGASQSLNWWPVYKSCSVISDVAAPESEIAIIIVLVEYGDWVEKNGNWRKMF